MQVKFNSSFVESVVDGPNPNSTGGYDLAVKNV